MNEHKIGELLWPDPYFKTVAKQYHVLSPNLRDYVIDFWKHVLSEDEKRKLLWNLVRTNMLIEGKMKRKKRKIK